MNKLLVLFTAICLFLSFAILAHAWNPADSEDIKDYANYVAENERISVGLLWGIMKAESDFKPNAHNPIGTASGVLQFLDSTFRHQCIEKYHVASSLSQKDNPFLQINCAIEMLKEPYGYKHWQASIANWGHLLAT